GTANPQAALDVANTGTYASAIIVPRDTLANRPSVPVNGMIRYNTNSASFEGYSNGSWGALAASGGGLPTRGGTMTGQLVGAAGSNGAPSFSFAGDTDTGFYSDTQGTIGVSSNGTETFKISNQILSPTTGGALITSANGTAAAPTYSFAGDPG